MEHSAHVATCIVTQILSYFDGLIQHTQDVIQPSKGVTHVTDGLLLNAHATPKMCEFNAGGGFGALDEACANPHSHSAVELLALFPSHIRIWIH